MPSKKYLVTKVVGLGKIHNSAKNGIKIQKFAMEVAKTMVTWVESQVNSCLVVFFVKSFTMKPWHGMFGIFSRYYITYLDSMRRFSRFLNFFEPPLAEFEI
jgi:hypothetical protein